LNVTFSARAWAQYQEWQETDRKIVKKLNALIRECARTPFAGLGKPEPLKGDLAGWWSRRIDREHRLVYRATDNGLEIVQCRYHYDR
jgi:toxin YoeB